MDWTGALHVIWISYAFSNTVEPHYCESLKCGLLMDILLRFCIDSQHNVEETTPLKELLVRHSSSIPSNRTIASQCYKIQLFTKLLCCHFTGSARISIEIEDQLQSQLMSQHEKEKWKSHDLYKSRAAISLSYQLFQNTS